ncbi:MAG: uracil phosphoribosyltransferase [Bacteroidetes bacterium]|nr:MAG: uracil phosphoribosyltransferase [Bacteroidota bacterium]
MVINLGEKDSIFNQFLSEIRSQEIQKDSMRFRRNMERLGELFAYEISKKLEYVEKEVISPLGISHMKLIKEYPILATILRAGLPLHQGMLNYFDSAECAFISAYRRHHKNGRFDIQLEYASSPSLEKKNLILIDPMLATGASMALTYKALLQFGKPKHTHIVVAIASMEGINYLKRKVGTKDVTIWTGAIDDEMTAQSYIVPGLGDAGDLAFGNKFQLD